jgi:1,4-dihydroxy-6-naphthoate synthase
MKLSLGFSPCPNDTYIFDALVHQKVDTEGLEFKYFLADVEELNARAFAETPDITKLSFHAFLHLADRYLLLDSGGALGFGAGPLVISRSLNNFSELAGHTLAIPGRYTTANLLFSLASRSEVEKKEMIFSDIIPAILRGDADAGVIIHESRFTYESSGLHKLLDLGEYWETLTGMPVPLGGIAVHRRLGAETAAAVNRCIRRSVVYANAHAGELSEFVRCHAQEMNEEVMRKHISLYVNEFSVDLGDKGRAAVRLMFRLAEEKGIIPSVPELVFATDFH